MAAPGRAGHRGLSDARATREGPTISDVYYHKSTRCGGGVAPAIASGYKTCLRADPLHRSPITKVSCYFHTSDHIHWDRSHTPGDVRTIPSPYKVNCAPPHAVLFTLDVKAKLMPRRSQTQTCSRTPLERPLTIGDVRVMFMTHSQMD